DDGVYDLVAGAGSGHAPEVAVFSGSPKDGGAAFSKELARFAPFDGGAKGGVSVAAGEIDGTTGDDIVVGSGPGAPSEVRVFASRRPAVGAAPKVFSSFAPSPGDPSGVTLATGFVDFATGHQSIVTARGPGTPSKVKVFVFPLLTRLGDGAGEPHHHDA